MDETKDMAEMVLDLSDVDKEGSLDMVTIRKNLEDILRSTPTLEDIAVTGVRMWAHGSKPGVLKFLVPIEKESVVRDLAQAWVGRLMPKAKLQGAPWFPVRLDWVPTELIKDPNGQLSATLKERLGTDNNVQVMHVRAFPGWQRKEHCSIVAKVLTRKEQEKLLDYKDEVVLHGASLVVKRYVESRRPLLCYNCYEFGHTAVRFKTQAKCRNCASTDHNVEQCESIVFKCANCNCGHRVTDLVYPVYIKEKTKYKNLSAHV